MAIEHVGVVGAGTMGAGIAQTFAQSGVRVTLVDSFPDALARGAERVRAGIAKMAQKGQLDAAAADAAAKSLSTSGALDALSGASLVVEAVPEKTELKEGVFRSLDALLPAASILASNTSSISITRLAAATKRPERVIGMHFMNPVPLMKLVEVVKGLATDEATTAAVVDLSKRLGKTPVVVNDYPGFVSNRILMPMINEAVFALMEGVAEKEAIDEVMRLGMNHPMGPLALADLVGLDVCLDILEVLHRELGDDRYRPCPLLRKMVAAGHLGRKARRGFYSYSS
jgi:3-hydroxybutyryl-CoA dehydrogenase